MADIQADIAGASQDLQTIEDFVNLPAGSDVRPRLLPSVNVGTLAGARQAIFEAGGLPATPFATKALMTASALVDGDYAMVTDDTVVDNNGLYIKTTSDWVKSKYDANRAIDAINNTSKYLGFAHPSNGYVYVEKNTPATNDLYINLKGWVYITKAGGLTGGIYTWSAIIDSVNKPELFVTSPRGIADCLILNDSALVYAYANQAFSVIPRYDIDASKYHVLAIVSQGILVGGTLYDSWVAQENLQYVLYMNQGQKDSAIPLFDMAPSTGTSTDAYIKLPDIVRIVRDKLGRIDGSWQRIKDDINNPELITTSHTGIADCIKLNNSCLVYNVFTDKFQVVASHFYDKKVEVLLANVAYGQVIDGLLYDWWVMKKAKLVTQSSSGDIATTSKNSNPQTRFIAHGGMNGFMQFAPLNTAPAYRNAGEYGYWGAETDIVETKDGEWIHCHDEFLSDYIVGGTGNFKDYTLAEIKAMDATKRSAAFGWTDVPPLELSEFLEICKQYGMTPVIEFKSVPTAAGVSKVLSLINNSVGISNCVLMSFNASTLSLIRAQSLAIKLGVVATTLTTGLIDTALSLGNCMLTVRSTNSISIINTARQAGLEVGLWTVSQSDIDNGKVSMVDYVTTDIGVPYDFDKGVIALNFKNTPDFSNMTAKPTAIVANEVMTLPSGSAHLDISVSYGDVISVSCLAKATDPDMASVIIRGLDASDAKVKDFSAKSISTSTLDIHTAIGVVYDKSVTKVRVIFDAYTTSISVRDIKIKKYEV